MSVRRFLIIRYSIDCSGSRAALFPGVGENGFDASVEFYGQYGIVDEAEGIEQSACVAHRQQRIIFFDCSGGFSQSGLLCFDAGL